MDESEISRYAMDNPEWMDAVAQAEEFWNTRPCLICQTATVKTFTRMNSGQNYGRVACSVCERFAGWVKKPENAFKRPGSTLNLAKKHGIEHCFICLRHKAELPRGQAIHGHHVDEHQHGGEGDAANIWGLCTHCHEFVHLIRRNIGHNSISEQKRGGAA